MKANKIMKKAAGASTGLAVAVAFFNVALLVVELAKVVTTDVSKAIETEEDSAAE